MRLLVPGRSGLLALADLDDAGLFAAYAAPGDPWVRCNMIASLDGAATGPDARSASINNAVVDVGAGTIRAEGYPPLSVADSLMGLRRDLGLPEVLPLVAVSSRGEVPST